MEQVPFCERNTRAWVFLLVGSAIVVLGYSLWVAWERGHLSGFSSKTSPFSGGAQEPLPATVGPPALAPAPVAPAAAAPPAAGGVQARAVDTITHATPYGGIRFIGGTKAPHLQSAFNRAADIIRPCVVNVGAVVDPGALAAMPAAVGARFIPPAGDTPNGANGQVHVQNVGSGLIVDPRGFIVTNDHVISGTSTIVVSRWNRKGDQVPATVVARDKAADLALLKVEVDGAMPAASFADSTRAEVGDWVLAVGNPFGLEYTVTAGIISARRSTLAVEGFQYRDLLQTDAPINRGSSGGPLVNLSGQVVGLNTAIWAPNGVFSGAGFAIPSNTVRAFVAGVLDNQATNVALRQSVQGASGAYIGVGVIDMTADLASKLGYPKTGGVFVSSVVLDSPADEAEITRGDVIVSLAGQPVLNQASLAKVLATYGPGTSVPMVVWRSGKTEKLRMTIAAGRRAGR